MTTNEAIKFDFYYSARAESPKLHLELGCSGLRYQRLRFSPGVACEIADHECNTARGPEALLERLFECRGEQVPLEGQVEAPGISASGPLGSKEIATHHFRLCRVCGLENALFAYGGLGPKTIAVTFSGQGVPDEIGTPAFKWGEVSASGRARLIRIADRLGWNVLWSDCGPVTYGKVSKVTAQILERNLRTYRLYGELAAHCERKPKSSAEVIEAAIGSYWMLRNHRPPELFGQEQRLTRMAKAISHL